MGAYIQQYENTTYKNINPEDVCNYEDKDHFQPRIQKSFTETQ